MDYKNQIDLFLEKNLSQKKMIVVYGPTACGKTGLGIEIAKYLNSEIISTDSRQIFKYLDIGTGKVTFEEMQGIPHHMIDIISPNIHYSVGEFKKEAQKLILEIHSKGKIPILVGGTGLYIDSLMYDFEIPEVPADENLRKILEDEAQVFGKEFVYEKLKKIDPEYAQEVHPNNLNYVIRGIEVKMLTGKSKKDFQTEKKFKYDTLLLTPYDGNREKLYEKINFRVGKMFEDGLIHEVENILKMGYKKTDFGLKTIGYEETIGYLEGKLTLQECITKVQQGNRNYAKRQLTWFGKYNY
ncbi:MAG: tRNA (adenosine(37)-N6)-dimethylallyltransferase MiaA [Candidatus Altimarinota bacterium]